MVYVVFVVDEQCDYLNVSLSLSLSLSIYLSIYLSISSSHLNMIVNQHQEHGHVQRQNEEHVQSQHQQHNRGSSGHGIQGQQQYMSASGRAAMASGWNDFSSRRARDVTSRRARCQQQPTNQQQPTQFPNPSFGNQLPFSNPGGEHRQRNQGRQQQHQQQNPPRAYR